MSQPLAPPAPGPRRVLWAALVSATVLALFFAPALGGGGQFLSRDAGRLHAPVKRWIADRLSRGDLPEWNPYDGLGAPVVSAAVDAVQHPFGLLLAALPFHAAFKAWILLSYLLAALGGYLWASALGRSFHASLAAGLAFALSGLLVSTSDNLTYLTAFASLPWIFATAHRWLERGGAGRLALLGVASGAAAAAGDPQSWGFAVASLPLYAAFLADRGRRSAGAAFGRGLVGLCAAAAGAAPFVLPVLTWLPHSSRGGPLTALDQQRYALAPLRLLELGLPHLTRGAPGFTMSDVYRAYAGDPLGGPWYVSLYAGATVLALAALGAARDGRARRLLVAAGFFTWMALGHHAGFAQLAAHLPVLSGFRFWEKMAVWPTLLLAVAAASGLEQLAGGAAGRRFAAASGAAAGLTLSLRAASALAPGALGGLVRLGPAPHQVETAARFAADLEDGLLAAGLACAALAAAALLARRPAVARWAPALLLAVVVLDLSAANVRAYALSPGGLAQPRSAIADALAAREGLQRVVTPFRLVERESPRFPELRPSEVAWLWGGRMLYPAFNVARRVGNLDPGGPMSPGRTMEFRGRTGLEGMLPAAGLWGVAWAVVPEDPRLGASVHVPPGPAAAAEPSLPAFLLEVPHRPRVYLAGDLSQVDGSGAMAFALDPASPASERSVVEAPIPDGYRPPRGTARLVLDGPERVTVETTSDGPALLVLNDAYAAGWTAAVDGSPAGILPANCLARGVWVPAGEHRVEFVYRTPGLRTGWAVFGAGALALAGWAALARRRGAG